MTIDFYCMPECPPCRVVELVANKMQIKLNKKYLNVMKGDHLIKQFPTIGSVHCVPTIVDGDIVLWESRAIISYMVNKYAKNDDDKSLYPEDAVLRAKVDMMLYFDMGVLYRGQRDFLLPILEGRKDLDVNLEMKFKRALAYVESIVSKTNYITGNTLTIADISIVCGLTFSEACDYDLSEFKSITLYRSRVKKDLPSYDSVNNEPIERGLSLLSSDTYWKFLMSDDRKNPNKRPCLDSCIISTSTTDIVGSEQSNNDTDTSIEEQKQSPENANSCRPKKRDEKFDLPKRHKTKIKYYNT